MKALITGAGGQVGRALLARVPPSVTAIGCDRAALDISDANAVNRCIDVHGPDVIINAAAYTAVDKAEHEPDAARAINADGPRLLAIAARRSNARLIHVSTDFVFDGAASRPYEPDAATHPLNVYGATKRDGEVAVLAELPGATLLRTAWVYSAHGRNFLNTMLRLMKTQSTVRVVNDQIGTPTSANSVADALWQLAAEPAVKGIHHWTDHGVASWYDFAVAIAEEGAIVGLVPKDVVVTPIPSTDYPTPARRPPYSVLDKRTLANLAIPGAHWRVRVREVLREIAHV